jgi:hypothetical protein
MAWTEVAMIFGAVAVPLVLAALLVEHAVRRSRRSRHAGCNRLP